MTLQGYPETYDEDGDIDDTMISVGTSSSSTTVQELIKLVAAEEVIQRKLEKPRTLRLWLARNEVYNGYKSKDSVTKMMRVSDCDGYDKKQVYAYLTEDINGPKLTAEEVAEATGGRAPPAGRGDHKSTMSGYDTADSPQRTPPATPDSKKSQAGQSPTASKSSKRRKIGDEPVTSEKIPGPGDAMDLEDDYGLGEGLGEGLEKALEKAMEEAKLQKTADEENADKPEEDKPESEEEQQDDDNL